MGGAHHCSGPPVSEMTYTVSSGTLSPSIPYHTIPFPSGILMVLNTIKCCNYKSTILNYCMVSISVLVSFSSAEELLDSKDNDRNLHS